MVCGAPKRKIFESGVELGHGGFGIVYLAWDENKKLYAVKKIKCDKSASSANKDYLRREKEMVERVISNSIITL